MSKLANKIGFFDSGLGGLTILKDVLDRQPNYNYVYLGDNARVPYGEKSPETIYNYTREAADFLFAAGCNLIIIACNTASAQALHRLQQEYLPQHYPERRILGVIRPLAEAIANDKNIKTVGVIGTKATIGSRAYEIELHKLNPELKVEQLATPLLVPLIEEGWADKPETKMILKKYLRPLKNKKITALILGCTHYPFLYPLIKRLSGQRLIVPPPGAIVAASLENYLARHPELNLRPVEKPEYLYYTTDDPKLFRVLGEKFLKQAITKLEKVKITP
ncbi:TPA: glutamate racemase [Candidatus Falkowbacteria bacterium]|nr:MAG: Glutamate racemase [Candidatus Falkowbacteria bacterium GW2011_GWF2_43_32]HBA36807.1 glutamate racemase [Candidatus Falkowbacteria bacterium]